MTAGTKMWLWFILGPALFFLFASAWCSGLLWPLEEIGLRFIVGWVAFLIRVIPQMTVDWGGTFTAILSLAGLGGGLHLFLRWLWAKVQLNKPPHALPPRNWKIRWTAAILGTVVLTFAAGIAAVGVTHQTAWLVSSPEPWRSDRSAFATQSKNNLKQQCLAAMDYYDTHKRLPAGGTYDKFGRGLHAWQTDLLPFIEQGALHKQIRLELPWHDPANAPYFHQIIPEYLNPYVESANYDAAGFALSHYAANVRVMGGGKPLDLNRDFPDGTSNTILIGEAAGNYRPWGHHANWRDPALGVNTTLDGFGSWNPRTNTVFVMADGSVRTISPQTSREILKALSTPAGGETLPANWDN